MTEAFAYESVLARLGRIMDGKYRPKDPLGEPLEERNGLYYWGRGEDYVQAGDARAHIESMAWRCLRAWASPRGYSLECYDNARGVVSIWYKWHHDGNVSDCLGQSETWIHALDAALEYVENRGNTKE